MILNSGLCSSHHPSKERERELNGLKLRHLLSSCFSFVDDDIVVSLNMSQSLNLVEGQHGYNSFDHFIKNQGKIKTSFNQKRL